MATVQPVTPEKVRSKETLDHIDRATAKLSSAAAILNSLFWNHAYTGKEPPLDQEEVAELISTAHEMIEEAKTIVLATPT